MSLPVPNDDEFKSLAESFGAAALLDKANLCDRSTDSSNFANSEFIPRLGHHIEYVSLVVVGLVPTIRAFVLLAAFQEIGPRGQKKVFKIIFDVEPC
jgi:hypothetical protein